MTLKQPPPINYRRNDGSTGTASVPVGDWPWPHIETRNGVQWESRPWSDDWLDIGYVPRPRTDRGWFLYHLMHGLLMRYPLRHVLVWSWRNRRASEHYDSTTHRYESENGDTDDCFADSEVLTDQMDADIHLYDYGQARSAVEWILRHFNLSQKEG